MRTRISLIQFEGFKRFDDLTIKDLPSNARLIVLAGPNGNGKSSIFDGMLDWRRRMARLGSYWNDDYHARNPKVNRNTAVRIIFHEPEPHSPDDFAGSIHIRTAHRNDPQINLSNISGMPEITKASRFQRLSNNDAGVSSNLQLLVGQDIESLYSSGDPNKTFEEHRQWLQGLINNAFKNLNLPLSMDGLGNPLQTKTFRFSKGTISGFHFDNLSGGERAIFDLLFDLIVQRQAFGDAVYCIDEPEVHINPNLHGLLLNELLSLVPSGGQLWVATHSIGMLRKARDLQRDLPDGEIVFLDFDQDFDVSTTLTPITPNSKFWKRALSTSIGDVADLIAPEVIVFCEGKNLNHELGEGTDAKIYNKIFELDFPNAVFTSLGCSNDVSGRLGYGVSNLFATIKGTSVLRLIDGDNHSTSEREAFTKQGVRVLTRRHIESYLFDDEIIQALCVSLGRESEIKNIMQMKADAIQSSVSNRGNQPDDVKKWCSQYRSDITKTFDLKGQSDQGFMLDVLAPLVTNETRIYKELKADIFG